MHFHGENVSCRKDTPEFLYCAPAPKTQGTLWKRGQNECKSQRMREFTARLCLLLTSEATPIKSCQHDRLHMSWIRRIPTNMPNWMGIIPWCLNPTQITIDKWVKLGEGEVVFPRKSTPMSYPVPNSHPWEHTEILAWTGQVMFRNVYFYAHTHMHAMMTSYEKEMIFLKENKDRFMGRFKVRKGKLL